MRSIASGVALSVGLVSTSITLFSAMDPKGSSGNKMVCTKGHAPELIHQPNVCPLCGEVAYQELEKARPVEGGFVLLDSDDITALGAEAATYKKQAAVTAHPAHQVGLLTGVGSKMYFLAPEPGHEVTYCTIMEVVRAHPELAFMTKWTPRSAVGQFQLLVHNDETLVMQERSMPGSMREAPVFTHSVNEQLVGLAEQILPALIADYDPEVYASSNADLVASIVAGKEVFASTETSAAPAVVPVTDLVARLQAQIAAGTKTPAEAPAKKAAAKKVAAKRTPAREKVTA